VATDHRDLHSSVSKVGKAIDRVSEVYFKKRKSFLIRADDDDDTQFFEDVEELK
jgi:hypothetical protein